MLAHRVRTRLSAENPKRCPHLDQMQHRSRLYELLRYTDYNQFDSDIFNVALQGVTS